MPYLNNFIRCADIHVCGNEEELYNYLLRIKNYPGQQQYLGLKSEIKEILEDDEFDYLSFLVNDEYELFFPYDPYVDKDKDMSQIQHEAKNFIIEKIWNKLYPDDQIVI